MYHHFEKEEGDRVASNEVPTAQQVAEKKADAMIRAAQERNERAMIEQQEMNVMDTKEGVEDVEMQERPLLEYLDGDDQKELDFYYAELKKAEGWDATRKDYIDHVRKQVVQLEKKAQERKDIVDQEQEMAELGTTKSFLPGKHWEDYNKDVDRQRSAAEKSLIQKHTKKGLKGWLKKLFG